VQPHRVTGRRLFLYFAVVAMVGLGVALSVLRPGAGASQPGLIASLWLSRPLDLMLHIGLMLAGALGIRALLPAADEDV